MERGRQARGTLREEVRGELAPIWGVWIRQWSGSFLGFDSWGCRAQGGGSGLVGLECLTP